MHTYCKLKDGRHMVLWSDNTTEETMSVFAVADLQGFNAEHQVFEQVPYSAVLRTDSNRAIAFAN